MQPTRVPVLPVLSNRTLPRTALLASADRNFRQRLSQILTGLRWQVREAAGGAEAWKEVETTIPEALIVDSWLPDLDHGEFLKSFRLTFPNVDLLVANGTAQQDGPRCPHRQELLYALRRSQETDTAVWNAGSPLRPLDRMPLQEAGNPCRAALPFTAELPQRSAARAESAAAASESTSLKSIFVQPQSITAQSAAQTEHLPELVGDAPCMIEISRRIRLVAARRTPVLIEGPTGSGKELVAQALHRLSQRSRKPFVAINCAAIPEALLEAELFGHTRGAFTGAVQARVGRIESADGGTLFLDEIGEMPLALQAKLLRFVESGELQRIGDNETIKVDLRIVAASHRPLAQHAQAGTFRSDLYYRLAVFLIRTPTLLSHLEDLPLLIEHFLERLGRRAPLKRIDAAALAKLSAHAWPGNVRELEHVLERAAILAGDAPVMTTQEIDFGDVVN